MKKTLNTLPKSQRERHRYILLNQELNEQKKLFYYAYRIFGLYLVSRFNMKFVKPKIVSVNREYVDNFLFIINFLNIKEEKKIKTIKISGTLQSLLRA